MIEKPYILAVDDSAMNINILKEALTDDFDLASATSGLECLDSVSKRKPELILLDVMMPNMDGLEVCRRLREDFETEDIPIIFVSALMSNEDRLNGYAAGGDDYITKPFNLDELQVKVSLTIKNNKEIRQLQEASSMAMQTAMTAMTGASELGAVLRFMQESFSCHELSSLAEKAFDCFAAYGLSGSMMLLNNGKIEFYFSDKIDRPLEKAVLEQVHAKDRIIEFGNRTFLNSNNVTLLIRKTPEDEETKGRYRDHLAILIDGIEARVEGIINEQKLLSRQQEINKAIVVTQNNLQQVNQQQLELRSATSAILSDVYEKILDTFSHLGLDEIQEKVLIEMIAESEKELDNMFDQGKDIDQQFAQIIQLLKSL